MGSDGGDLIPTWIDYLIINPGETYDVMVFGNNTPGNYWIRLETTEVLDFFYVREVVLTCKKQAIFTNPVKIKLREFLMFEMFSCTQTSPFV